MKLKQNTKDTPAYILREEHKKAVSKEVKADKPKTKNVHEGHRERLKKQYLTNGIHSLTDIQKLELLLFYAIPQKDTNPIAHALLDKFGSIKGVLHANPRELAEIDGIKDSTATFFKLVSNMATVCSLPKEGALIGGTTDGKTYCSKFYVGVTLEQFHVVCLSASNKVLGSKLIKAGTVDQVNVDIRDITEFAVNLGCNRILVSHNHPNGEGRMSDEDLRFTYSLICSCLLNSIEVLDHIIVGKNSVYSMNENQVIQRLVQRAHSKVLISEETKIFLSNIRKTYKTDQIFDCDIKIDF